MTDGRGPTRRRLLRTLGVGVAGVTAGCQRPLLRGSGEDVSSPSPTPSEPTGTPGIAIAEELGWFDETVVAVDDIGLDPTGSKSISSALNETLEEGQLVIFPPGEYLVETPISIPADRIGFVGRGDARFRLPDGFGGRFVSAIPSDEGADAPDKFLFTGIDVDMRADCSGHIRLKCPSAFLVENVEYLGRGRGTGYAFVIGLGNGAGVGTLRNVRVLKGSRIDGYNAGNGRIGIWTGNDHRGTLRVESCDFREFGNNAMYTSRTPGNVQVVDSYFENNSPASVRISGDGSYVANSTIRLDLSSYTGPNLGTGFNARGVVIDQKKGGRMPIKPAGARITNCSFEYLNVGPKWRKAQGVIHIWGPSRSLNISDTTIHVDADFVPAVHRERPSARGPFRPEKPDPPPPHWVRLDNVSITGSANGGAAVEIVGTSWSAMRNTTIEQTGYNRDGVRLVDTTGFLLHGGRIRCSGAPVVIDPDGTDRDVCRIEFGKAPDLERIVRPELGVEEITGTPIEELQDVSDIEPPTCGWPVENGGISVGEGTVLEIWDYEDGQITGWID